MFTVNKTRINTSFRGRYISKHFMFTVNVFRQKLLEKIYAFQNISCLRLIYQGKVFQMGEAEFQNISCLRLINTIVQKCQVIEKFQNISCLRLILNH